uniref:Dynamin GTPase n=2 Tax=Aplanochytrium stocchinoi TaxID=215587 RepID=A0A7S3PDL9_9STRA|mmetsp:Transcript_32800/g.40290  ORF Transcript_32800/g.40290 Transcript_32800/m.40290 type:complete len:771 (+) Transcript_32800:122-2434(+)|eukprot:CAMPEP_0204838632 /NCGR_PEP_ID=MMETSP1346-20131115/31397_1 /ASSEMBLY_ACC=CAM_ASM_000771 /TAXON_ID=215587 /ORGANISM="Aplanochytrium stocchinoi, Strain GSBS06" /LENGTH=770 /DNA_ID=CAMNT_0051974801 /DNA_START=64 /DNA_END=2376 /DNA_ORIENTATION=+
METLIPLINKLQDVFSSIGHQKIPIDLPQIVVVGSQSAGKSSVLESIVGREFLPRGDGLCTRRPLILQLYHTNPGEYGGNRYDEENYSGDDDALNHNVNDAESDELYEYAEFLHIPNQIFTDFDAVREEILKETTRISGENKGISDKPIRLRVYSPDVLTLTLIDLPGITRNPVGDQPSNIESLVRDMCMEYVSNPNAFILAVTAANTDLANSDALNIAKLADPAGERTLGVITKLDLMDEGTDAMTVFKGKIIPLKRGYIGVVNRSQADINRRASVQTARQKEKQFFLNHPAYRPVAHRMGTAYLMETLNSLLLHHIRDCLPAIKMNVNKQLLEVEKELNSLGSAPVDVHDEASQGEVMLGILTRFATNFTNAIEGKGFNVSTLELSELGGGARIGYVFSKVFAKRLDSISAFESLSDEDIKAAIVYAMGPRPSLFVPELSFEILVKRQIVYFEQPSLQCANQVYEVLQDLAVQSECPGLRRFPLLREKVIDVVNDMLNRMLQPTNEMIRNLFHIEKAYINTNHPDFIGGSNAIASLMNNYHTSGARRSYYNHVGRHRDQTSEEDRDLSLRSKSANMKENKSNAVNKNPDQSSGNQAGTDGNFMSFLFKAKSAENEALDGSSSTMAVRTSISMGGSTSVSSLSTLPPSLGTTAQQEIETDIIKELMRSYLGISKKNIQDLVPKTIMHFLVNYARDNVQNELVREIYNDKDSFKVYLQEDQDVAIKRAGYFETQKLLLKTLEVLGEVREFKVARSPAPVSRNRHNMSRFN